MIVVGRLTSSARGTAWWLFAMIAVQRLLLSAVCADDGAATAGGPFGVRDAVTRAADLARAIDDRAAAQDPAVVTVAWTATDRSREELRRLGFRWTMGEAFGELDDGAARSDLRSLAGSSRSLSQTSLTLFPGREASFFAGTQVPVIVTGGGVGQPTGAVSTVSAGRRLRVRLLHPLGEKGSEGAVVAIATEASSLGAGGTALPTVSGVWTESELALRFGEPQVVAIDDSQQVDRVVENELQAGVGGGRRRGTATRTRRDVVQTRSLLVSVTLHPLTD